MSKRSRRHPDLDGVRFDIGGLPETAELVTHLDAIVKRIRAGKITSPTEIADQLQSMRDAWAAMNEGADDAEEQ